MSNNVYMALFIKRGYATQEELEELIDTRIGLRQFEKPDNPATSQEIWGVWPNRDERGWSHVMDRLSQLRAWCHKYEIHGEFAMEDEHGWQKYRETI